MYTYLTSVILIDQARAREKKEKGKRTSGLKGRKKKKGGKRGGGWRYQ